MTFLLVLSQDNGHFKCSDNNLFIEEYVHDCQRDNLVNVYAPQNGGRMPRRDDSLGGNKEIQRQCQDEQEAEEPTKQSKQK